MRRRRSGSCPWPDFSGCSPAGKRLCGRPLLAPVDVPWPPCEAPGARGDAMLRFATGSILSLGLLAAAPAASAQSVVLQASGPSAPHFPVGGSLPDEAVVALQVGDRLTVTGPLGVRTYVGP